MNDADKKAAEVVIRYLIKAEEEAALGRFRTSRFPERLGENLRTRGTQPGRPAFFPAISRPIWISAAALLLVAGTLLSLRPFKAPASNGTMTVASFLRQLPGMQVIEKTPQISEFSFPPGSALGEEINAALSGPNAQPGAVPTLGRDSAFIMIDPKIKPMGLEELYNILIVNKSVERVLLDASQKTKEG
jgi:hypothetical protein